MKYSLLAILGIIFIALKLAEVGAVATWSWLWVLSPFWIPSVLVISTFLIAFLFVFMGKFIFSIFKK